jgi:hypothetical protein
MEGQDGVAEIGGSRGFSLDAGRHYVGKMEPFVDSVGLGQDGVVIEIFGGIGGETICPTLSTSLHIKRAN